MPIEYVTKLHEGWWCLFRIAQDGREVLVNGPHFGSREEARRTAEYLTQQKARHQTATGNSKKSKLQEGE
jgi:hypothetical protein